MNTTTQSHVNNSSTLEAFLGQLKGHKFTVVLHSSRMEYPDSSNGAIEYYDTTAKSWVPSAIRFVDSPTVTVSCSDFHCESPKEGQTIVLTLAPEKIHAYVAFTDQKSGDLCSFVPQKMTWVFVSEFECQQYLYFLDDCSVPNLCRTRFCTVKPNS